ncbi:MAG: hypothetical protein ACE5HE_13810 [Phycisphaerae bacterium]
MMGTFADSYGSTGGGEFIFTPLAGHNEFNGVTYDPFITFCLETNEYLDIGSAFKVVDIGPAAHHGGEGGSDPDPLDERTAWLYQSFRDGSLAAYGYDYGAGPGRVASADALQTVIWGIEDELGSWVPGSALETAFFNAASTNANGLGSVRVLNIAWPSGKPAQSQLVLIPVPNAILLGVVGLGMIGCAKRRRVE